MPVGKLRSAEVEAPTRFRARQGGAADTNTTNYARHSERGDRRTALARGRLSADSRVWNYNKNDQNWVSRPTIRNHADDDREQASGEQLDESARLGLPVYAQDRGPLKETVPRGFRRAVARRHGTVS